MKKVMEKELGTKELNKRMEAILVDDKLSKSGKMKELFGLGLEVKSIASLMGVRYNFVYNVVSNMVIMEGIKVENTKQQSKKDDMWVMFDAGKTVKEVAITLKTNLNYVYKLRKEWEAEVAAEVAKLGEVK